MTTSIHIWAVPALLAIPPWFPCSVFGLVLAIPYTIIAVVVVKHDRKETSGGWITLHGLGSFLITLPVSFIGEKIGLKPDHRSNAAMGTAILLCAVLVYLIGAAIGWGASLVMSGATP